MLLKITSRRQVACPARVLDAMGLKPGDRIELPEGPDGYRLRPRHIDHSCLGTLADKIPKGHPPFDIRTFREQSYDPGLRD